jgi:hypothetical protein
MAKNRANDREPLLLLNVSLTIRYFPRGFVSLTSFGVRAVVRAFVISATVLYEPGWFVDGDRPIWLEGKSLDEACSHRTPGLCRILKKLPFERLLAAVMTSFYPSMATTISSSQAEPDFIALNSSANGCISAKPALQER